MTTMPVWYIDRPGQSGLYGVPTAEDQGDPGGVKVAMHGDGTAVDPDAARRPVSSEELEAIRAATEAFLPCAAGGVVAGSTCLYTMSPDGHFVVDRMPDCGKVFVACGFSGHGFKFMPVMGEALADLATSGSTSLPTGFLGVGRFGTGS
jgi:sarcosine oxidase